MIQTLSAGFDGGNYAKITINNMPVTVEENESKHYRGMHVVVISNIDGSIQAAKVFDTYTTSTDFEEFIQYEIPDGYIIVAGCMDECTSKLSHAGKQWFADLGSKEIWNLEYR